MKQLVSNLLGSLREHDISLFASKLDSFLAGKHESKRAGAARTVVRELVSNGLFSEDTAKILSRAFEKHFPSQDACSKHNENLVHELEALLFELSEKNSLTTEFLDFVVSCGTDLNEKISWKEDYVATTFPMIVLEAGPLDPKLLEHAAKLGLDIRTCSSEGVSIPEEVALNGRLTPELLDCFVRLGVPMKTIPWGDHILCAVKTVEGAVCAFPAGVAEWFAANGIDVAKKDCFWGRTAIAFDAYLSFASWARFAEEETVKRTFDECAEDWGPDTGAAAVALLYTVESLPDGVRTVCENLRDSTYPGWVDSLFRSNEIWRNEELREMSPTRFFEAASGVGPGALEGKLSEEAVSIVEDALKTLGKNALDGNESLDAVEAFLSDMCARVLGAEAARDEECGGGGPVL